MPKKEVTMMLDKFKRTKQTQNKKGDYLKYQEGEVVPVHSKQVAYPPFLNDEDEISVKQYKDILREQQEKDRQAMPASSSKNNTRQSAGQETPSKDDNPKKQSVGLSGKWLLRFVWLVVLGGLIYYAIPIFQHFTSETPNLANVEESTGNVTEPIEESTVVDDVSEGTKAIVNEVQETTEGLAEKSGLVEKANESFVTDTKDTDQDLVQLPDDQWLNTLSSTHNTKQQKLMEIQGYTAAFANGEISHNRYKMLMKGINKDQIGRAHV